MLLSMFQSRIWLPLEETVLLCPTYLQVSGLPIDTSTLTASNSPLVLTYSAIDAAGNPATNVLRYISVVNPCNVPEIVCPLNSLLGGNCSTLGRCDIDPDLAGGLSICKRWGCNAVSCTASLASFAHEFHQQLAPDSHLE